MRIQYKFAAAGVGLLVIALAWGQWNSRTAQVAAAEQASEKKSPEKRPALAKFMHAKLGLSQDLLQGLVEEDFDLIEKRAKALTVLTVAEEFKVSNDPLYKQHSDQFLRASKQISTAATKKNLDSAALSFVQLTMTCIECHKFVRNELVAERK